MPNFSNLVLSTLVARALMSEPHLNYAFNYIEHT
jgi:hypothetical protein